MFVDVRIDNATRKALAIPQEAIIPTADGARVVKVGSDGAYAPVDIKTGLKSGDYVEVLDGLKAGDEIVVSGQFLLDSESNLQASFRRLGAE
jgi:Cu(I)/Ag(I) efflux system membrane fusion protein